MYDSVTASAIPTSARFVAGYANGLYTWSSADWARFPNAVKVRVTISSAHTGDGHFLDVEQGDATATQAPDWVVARRNAGVDAGVYCSASAWQSVINAFSSRGIAQPHYWIAHYDNIQNLPSQSGLTAIAKQYIDPPGGAGGNYDLSFVNDAALTHMITGAAMTMTTDQVDADIRGVLYGDIAQLIKDEAALVISNLRNVLYGDIAALIKSVAATTDVDVAAVLTAVQSLGTGNVDVNALATSLANLVVPKLPAGVTAQEVADAVTAAFVTKLGNG